MIVTANPNFRYYLFITTFVDRLLRDIKSMEAKQIIRVRA